MDDLIKRRDATQATLDAVKGKPFRLGRNDCARIAASHLRRMGHHVRLPAAGSYASVRGAMKALADRGYADLLAAMDGMRFERIAPAAAHVGDIIALPTESPLGCLTVALTNGRALGFVDDVAEASVLQPVEYAAAWRVPHVDQSR